MAVKYPYAALADQYITDILSGKRLAGEWVIKACRRHREDMERSRTTRWPYQYSRERAERACKFISYLPHIKGKWALTRQKIVLEPWQCFIICMIFGWVDKRSKLRRFRRALWMVPRKNAKTTLAAGIGLYGLTGDEEFGAEVYCGATSEKQALEVFSVARQMALMTPALRQRLGISVTARSLSVPKTNSKFEPVIGLPGDGASPSIAIHDELHEHATSAQLETMETGMGARDQPLQLSISTAGTNISSPCYDLMKNGEKILNKVVEDDRFFFINYTLDIDDDWSDPDAAIKANPNYGVSVSAEYLQDQRNKALYSSRAASAYKTKNLNLWVNSAHAYFPIDKWLENKVDGLNIETYRGRDAWASMDLSSKIDIASVNVLIPLDEPETFVTFGFHFLPEETIQDPARQHYLQWRDDGHIIETQGQIIDYSAIKEKLAWLKSLLTLQEIAYDPFQATGIATELGVDGYPMLEFRQSVQNYSEPMKQVEAWMRDKRIIHNGDPVLSFGLSNVVAKEDHKRNVYPRRPNVAQPIDPAIGLLMSAATYISRGTRADDPNIYQTANIVTG